MKIRTNINDPMQINLLRLLFKIDPDNTYFVYEIGGGQIDISELIKNNINIHIRRPYGYFMVDSGKYNLDQYIRLNPSILSTFNIIYILQYIMNNIKILNTHKIVHCDLKLPNIMLDLDPDLDPDSDHILDWSDISKYKIKFIDFNLSYEYKNYKSNLISYNLRELNTHNMIYPIQPPFLNILDSELLHNVSLCKSEMRDYYLQKIHPKYYADSLLDIQPNSYDFIFDDIYDDELSVLKISHYIDRLAIYLHKIDIFSVGISFIWMYNLFPIYKSIPIMELLYNMTNIQPDKQFDVDQVLAELNKLKLYYKLE
jgi:serine/threonine protein kinase